MKLFAKKERKISREAALKARPLKLPNASSTELPNQGVRVMLHLEGARWLQKFGGGKFARNFELDQLGREVYEACDGETNVETIVKNFAAAHNLNLPAAENAVTTFLKMLMSKGLIVMEVENQTSEASK